MSLNSHLTLQIYIFLYITSYTQNASSQKCLLTLNKANSHLQNRKNDEASYEKMLKLRRDLSRAVTILEMIKRREKSKRELLHLTLEIMEKR